MRESEAFKFFFEKWLFTEKISGESIREIVKFDRNLIFLLRVKQPRSGKLKTEKNR